MTSMSEAVVLLALMAASFGLVSALTPIFALHSKKNYTGRLAPTGLGLSFVLPTAGVWLAAPPTAAGVPGLILPFLLVWFALLGLVDDLAGDGQYRGYRGHLRALLRGQLSTGGLKAAGGAAAACLVGRYYGHTVWDGAVAALIIVFSANLINLMDLRPGRAGKAFVILALLIAAVQPSSRWLLPLVAAVVGYLPWDLSGRVMMGDTGSNPLGALWGAAGAAALSGWPRLALLAALALLNAAAERVSFSQIIAEQPLLTWLDKLGRSDGGEEELGEDC